MKAPNRRGPQLLNARIARWPLLRLLLNGVTQTQVQKGVPRRGETPMTTGLSPLQMRRVFTCRGRDDFVHDAG
jgi:hypothetical protein